MLKQGLRDRIVAFRRKQGFVGRILLKTKLKVYLNFEFSEFQDPLKLRFKNKHLWAKKAIGIGVTELFLRLMS